MQKREDLEQQAKALGMDLSYQPEVSMENIELLPESYWHKTRTTGLGGSNEGALNGVSHFNTLTDIMYEKVLGKTAPVSDELQFIFDYGHAMEWVLLKRYANLNGYKFLTYIDYFVIVESSENVESFDSRFKLAMTDVYSFKTRDKQLAEQALADISKKYPAAHIEEQESNTPKDVREITPEEHEAYDAQGIVCVDRRQYRHSLHECMLGDMDGLCITPTGEKIGLECKTYSYDQKKFQNAYASGVLGESGKVGKQEYILQTQHYMSVLNLDRFDLIACCGNKPTDLTVTTIYRDLDAEKQLNENCEEKWEQIQNLDVKPEEIDDKSFTRLKSTLAAGSEANIEVAELDESFKSTFEEMDALVKEINDLDAQKETKQKELNAKQLAIIEALNNHKAGVIYCSGEDYNIEMTYKGQMRGGFDSKKLKANHPDIYEQYVKESKECEKKLDWVYRSKK